MLGPGFAVGVGHGRRADWLGARRDASVPAAGRVAGWRRTARGRAGSAPRCWPCPYLAGAVGGLLVVRIAPTTVLEAAPIRGFCCGVLTGVRARARRGLRRRSARRRPAVRRRTVGLAGRGGRRARGRHRRCDHRRARQLVVRPDEVGCQGKPARRTARPARSASRSATATRRGRPWIVDGMTDAGDHDGHVIYVDRWASDEDGGGGGARGGRRSGGPSALP